MLSLGWVPRELPLGHVIVLIAEEMSESPLVTCTDSGLPPLCLLILVCSVRDLLTISFAYPNVYSEDVARSVYKAD